MGKSANVIEVDDGSFDELVLRSDRPVLVEFGGAWCPPCRTLEPIVARLADEMVGKVRVVAVDIDDSPGVASRYGIRGVPTVMVFADGAPKGQIVGVTGRERLLALLGATGTSNAP
jgi:thioredoxin 1